MKNGKYILVNAPENYPGKKYRGRYVYEHRLVWWQNTNDLADGFVIHHKNSDEHDNRFENLEKKNQVEHAVDHGHDRANPHVTLKCPNCSGDFTVEYRQRHRKFCSRPCQYEGMKLLHH